MATLTVTARGQVTFRKEVLQHLGIEPGGRMCVPRLRGETWGTRAWGRRPGLYEAGGSRGEKDTSGCGAMSGVGVLRLRPSQSARRTPLRMTDLSCLGLFPG
jgi:hypothetical protein